jgi:hypothetical protein
MIMEYELPLECADSELGDCKGEILVRARSVSGECPSFCDKHWDGILLRASRLSRGRP